MNKKRDRLTIIKEILTILSFKKTIKPTRLLHSSNLSPQMFKSYISELTDKKMLEINDKKEFLITLKGRSFLEEYKEIEKIIQNFGL